MSMEKESCAKNLHKIQIGVVQINNSFSNHNYLPYSVGLLQAYACKYLSEQERFEFLLPIFKRIPIPSAVELLLDAEVVFFSTYVWNAKISLEIARRLKQINPQILTVFGGPQIPEKGAENFLRKNRFVDIACRGEGEITFLSILENYDNQAWINVPSISYIDGTGKLIQTPNADRIRQLDLIPSPYLEGIFDPLMEENQHEEWIALFETDRGCPFSCTYCDWGSATKSKVYAYDIERIFKEIDWFSKRKIAFVFCCDANFGILGRDLKIVQYFAENKIKYGYPQALSVQNTKNATDHTYALAKAMAESDLNKGVALSLQSMNRETLSHIRRANISVETFQQLQERFTSDNIETFTDLILGLPCETYESFVQGVTTVIEKGQHNRIQFNNLSILPNAEMSNPEYQKKYDFSIVETRIINAHGTLRDFDDIYETQQLVLATKSMPKEDWVRARVFSWITALLHFDKLLQIPFIISHKCFSVSFRTLLQSFVNVNESLPVLFEIRNFFLQKAIELQKGGPEFCESQKWLNIWWPADELVFITLCTENKLKQFYTEAENVLNNIVNAKKGKEEVNSVIKEAITLNCNLLKMPFQERNLHVTLSYNIWQVYHSAIKGLSVPLIKGPYHLLIDKESIKWTSWEEWCRDVVWYGNKKGAYLYQVC